MARSLNPQPINPSYDNGSTVNPNPVPNDDDTEGIPAVETATVNGTWYDAKNGLYYLDINQNGSTLNITSYSLAGQPTGQGSGNINGRQISLAVNVVDFGLINIDAALSGDGLSLNGTTRIENNGAAYSEPLLLTKR